MGGNLGSERGSDFSQITKGKHNGGTRIHTQAWLPPVPTVSRQPGTGGRGGGACNYPFLREETDAGGRALPQATQQVTGNAKAGPPECQR